MISLELSTVQQNRERSAALDAAVQEFLSRGGEISTLKGVGHKPRPYGRMANQEARPPAPRRRTKEALRAIAPEPPPPPRGYVSDELIAQVRHMATTMTITDVGRQTGISRHMLRKIASAGAFEFQSFDPTPALKAAKVERMDPIADAMNVLRIKEARDRGLSRKAAKDLIGISNTLMERLIADYRIDYPLKRIRSK